MALTTSVPRATATSRARPQLDPRLVVGLLLVLASVAGTVGIVALTDRTIPVYASTVALLPGDRVRADQLVERRVTLDGADRLYLREGRLPRTGLVATRYIARGELIPSSAVGSAAKAGSTSVVLRVSGTVSAEVAPGARVEVWAAPDPDAGASDAVPGALGTATVVRVSDDRGLVAGDTVAVEILIPRSRIPRLLEAQARGDRLSLFPESLSLGAVS